MRAVQLLFRVASALCGLVATIAALWLPFAFIYTVSAEPSDQFAFGGRALGYGFALLMFAVLAYISYTLFRFAISGFTFPHR